MRHVAREGAQCHQKPGHTQHKECKGNDDEGRENNRPGNYPARNKAERYEYAKGDASISKGARSRSPGDGLAGED